MKHNTSIVSTGAVLALVLSSCSLCIPLEAKTPFVPQIAIQPTSQEVPLGETFQVDVYVDAKEYRLRGVTIDLTYPSSILKVTNISLGPLFGSSFIMMPGSGDSGTGDIHYTVLTSQRLSSSKGIFLTVTFCSLKGTPDSQHLLKLTGFLYSWNYGKISETHIASGYFILSEPDYDESFTSVSLSGFDSNKDGRNDAVQILMDVNTTGSIMDVFVEGTLFDPSGQKDDESSVSWSIPGSRSLYLYGDGPGGWFQITLHLFDILNHHEDSWTGTIYLYPLVLPVTYVNVTPITQTVEAGESFSISVAVNPGEAFESIQLGIRFNHSFLVVTEVREGDLFEGVNRYFSKGSIDNLNGTITEIYTTAIAGNVTDLGIFIIMNGTAQNLSGMSTFSIINARIIVPDGTESCLVIQNASILVESLSRYDLNGDRRINILDLILVASHWGETSLPGWIVADFNTDGVINVLDVFLLGEHWTG